MIPLRHHELEQGDCSELTTVEEVVRVTAADLEMVDE